MELSPVPKENPTPPRQDRGGVARVPLSPFTFPIISVHIAGFFFSLHSALTSYVDSSFLSTIFGGAIHTPWGDLHDPVGVTFAVGSFFTLIILAYAPRILRKVGNHNATLAFIVTEILLFAGIAYFKSALLSALFFAIHLAALPSIRFSLDLFLESASHDETTGTTRGLFLTIGNLAWVIAPLGVGFLLTNGDYWKVYIVSAALMLPVWYLVAERLHFYPDPSYTESRFWKSARAIFANKNTRRVFISDLLLWFFYAWMDIYTPLYLHAYVGFSWQAIALIFVVMLLPFIFLQYPLGRLADKYFGEKELLIGGFLIMSLSTLFIGLSPVLTAPLMIAWMAALFVTRIGASTVEVMDETYFFKQVNSADAHLLGFYRNTAPLGLLIAPLSAAIIFEIRGSNGASDFRFLFLVLSAVMLLGVWNALLMKDTR